MLDLRWGLAADIISSIGTMRDNFVVSFETLLQPMRLLSRHGRSQSSNLQFRPVHEFSRCYFLSMFGTSVQKCSGFFLLSVWSLWVSSFMSWEGAIWIVAFTLSLRPWFQCHFTLGCMFFALDTVPPSQKHLHVVENVGRWRIDTAIVGCGMLVFLNI